VSEEMDLKVRAWNPLVRKMLYFANPIGIIDNKDRHGIFLKSLDGKMYIGGSYKPMMFSGLRDSKRTKEHPNGQEIYDGDILRYYSDARMYLPNGSGGWEYKGNPHLEERTVVQYTKELGAYTVHGTSKFLFEMNDKSEIIGNIHENPELMEEWK